MDLSCPQRRCQAPEARAEVSWLFVSPSPAPGRHMEGDHFRQGHSPQTCRARWDLAGPSLRERSDKGPCVFKNSQSCQPGPMRVHESAFVLHSENYEWYPESQAQQNTKLPSSGTVPKLGSVTRQLFCPFECGLDESPTQD